MKYFLTFFMFVAVQSLFAMPHPQKSVMETKMTLETTQTTVGELLMTISKQHKLNFLLGKKIDKDKIVKINVNRLPLQETLDLIAVNIGATWDKTDKDFIKFSALR